MAKLNVYICGPVTGIETVKREKAFNNAVSEITRAGMKPVNPLNIVSPGTSWKEAMKQCIPELLKCDAIYKLDNWQSSKGALLEAEIANKLGIPSLSVNNSSNKLKIYKYE